MDISKGPSQGDPTQEPSATAPRMEWMQWEHLWRQATGKADEKLLARLIGTGVDTPRKQEGAALALEAMASEPRLFEAKLLRLLLRNGARIPGHLVAPLCVCGDKAIELMQKYKVDLFALNHVGENGLAMACMIGSEAKFERAWRTLRRVGLDPLALDDCKENALDAAERLGKADIVERIETSILAEQAAGQLAQGTPKARQKSRPSRL